MVNVNAVGATPAAALALDKGFVDAMNTYTYDQAKSALLGEEQQTEATLYSVLTDIQDQFRPRPQRSGSPSPSERSANLFGESRDSATCFRTPGGASALGPVHGRGRHWNPHHRPKPDVTCGGWARDRSGPGRPGSGGTLASGQATEDGQAGSSGSGLSGRRRDPLRTERLDGGLPHALARASSASPSRFPRGNRAIGCTTGRTRCWIAESEVGQCRRGDRERTGHGAGT